MSIDKSDKAAPIAKTFSSLAALAEDVERAELDILRRALDRLTEIVGKPEFLAERQALIRVVNRAVETLFGSDAAVSGPLDENGYCGAAMPGPCSCLSSQFARLEQHLHGRRTKADPLP
ncbi:hypothetical protein [Pseudothauera lacus]|uniref:hypothetical protein n=1 Tax=Pseudothauera lacus TaxID=2136175 RepID=UPI0011B20513|nr:hypothetical protein [Pseudothauera lacus]